MKTLLLPAQLLPVSRCLNLFKSRLHPTFIHRLLGTKMATASTAAQLTISLPCQLNEPVIVEPAPGVSDSDFRKHGQVPGIVFARGPAVAVLILLDSDGETYAVLTEQVRVPVGKLILELPAGMLDEDKDDIVGTAVREVEEETGIQLKLDDVIDLTAFLDPSTGCRVFPSPGGCDEDLGLFLYRASVGKDIITELSGKQTGLRDHGELIRVHVVPYKNLWRMTADAKVLMAIALYEMAKRDGLLPPLQDFSTAI